MDDHDLLDYLMLAAHLCHAAETPPGQDPPCAANLSAVRESLARIRAVVEAADGLPDWGPPGGATYARLQSVLDALMPDDRRLLGMDR
jgi:hypothetical protein